MEITSSANLNLSAFTDLKTVTISTTEADAVVNLTTNSEDLEIITGTTTSETQPTINLYGTAGKISAGDSTGGSIMGATFGMNSLHVYGYVDAIYCNTGHIVIESEAEVNYIVFTSNVNASKNNIDLAIKDGGKLNYLATSNAYGISGLTSILPKNEATSSTKIIADRDISTYKTYTAGGIGEKNAPYLINNVTQLLGSHKGNYAFNNEPLYFRLTNDITLETSFAPANPLSDMVLDLAGHTITLKAKQTDLLLSAFIVQKGSHLTIEDSVGGGSIVTPNTYATDKTVGYIFAVIGESSLTIDGGTFVGGMSVVQTQDKASAVINGGTYSTLVPENNINYVLNRIDASDKNATDETPIESSIVVNGGEFKNFNPAAPETDPDENGAAVSYLGNGCKSESTEKDGATWWVVTK